VRLAENDQRRGLRVDEGALADHSNLACTLETSERRIPEPTRHVLRVMVRRVKEPRAATIAGKK
jgi:hypothetical protein